MIDWIGLTKWIYWIVGGVGITGVVLIFLFAPALAGALLRGFVAVLTELLGTRLGCAIIAAVIVGLGINYMRASIDEQQFAARTAQFEAKQKARDEQIAADTRAQVEKEQADLAASEKTIDTSVKDFTDAQPIIAGPTSVPLPVANPLRVGADACRLRVIAGLAACGPESGSGVSGARKKAATAIHHARQRLSNPGGAVARPAP